jgi:hypothetical protein
MWMEDLVRARRYLPQSKNESERDYLERLNYSSFERKFAQAIDNSAAVLSNFTLPEILPPRLRE